MLEPNRTFKQEYLIDSPAKWSEATKILLQAKQIAVDMESNGFYTFPESICLIQLAVNRHVFIVDPLVVKEIPELGAIFSNHDVEKIMHSCDYDLKSFDRDYGFQIKNIFDTELAARFCGSALTGLDSVLNQYLGININKSKRLQRANWGSRPLSDELLFYAANDVYYLNELKEKLTECLTHLNRLNWVKEECERLESTRYIDPGPPEESFLKAKGYKQLAPKERSIFRELYIFRHYEALRLRKPPFKVIPQEVLLFLARNPYEDLKRVTGLSKMLLIESGQAIKRAINNGLSLPPLALQRTQKKKQAFQWNSESMARFALLKKWRNQISELYGISACLIWPSKGLESLALAPKLIHNPNHLLNECEVRNWQYQQFKKDIETLLNVSTKNIIQYPSRQYKEHSKIKDLPPAIAATTQG